jgi:integral membrane protein
MPLEPKPTDIPRIPGALRLYQVSSIITGVFLLLLTGEVILKFVFQYELELGGPGGFLALVPRETVTAFNLSTAILIVHGWLYVLYLFSDFQLWSMMRWSFPRFLLIALGGIIPTLSFFLEVRVAREVRAYLAVRAAADSSASPAGAGASAEARS